MSLGLWPIGARPIGALRRGGGLTRFSAFVAAGASSTALVSGPAAGALNAAGVGVASFVSGPATGALQASGVGTYAGNLLGKGSAVVAMAGAGSTGLTIFSQNFSAMATAGAGVFAPTLTAKASSTVSMQGQGNLGEADSPTSIATFQGAGAFVGVIYAFFADAEKAAPLNEVRVAYAPVDPSRWRVEPPAYAQPEPRTVKVQTKRELPAVVPFENRVYDVAGKQRTAKPPNRRRVP